MFLFFAVSFSSLFSFLSLAVSRVLVVKVFSSFPSVFNARLKNTSAPKKTLLLLRKETLVLSLVHRIRQAVLKRYATLQEKCKYTVLQITNSPYNNDITFQLSRLKYFIGVKPCKVIGLFRTLDK